ncbi:cytochrome P450, partial [Clavulina sp. PMI_390]
SAFVLFSALVAFYLNWNRKPTKKYFPGPPATPIIGHLRELSTENPHLYYGELNKKYGMLFFVVRLTALNRQIILVGSFEAANELLAKRGTIYSGRPDYPLGDHYLDLVNLLPVCQYNPTMKEQRRLYHNFLGKEVSREVFRPEIEAEAQAWVLESLTHPISRSLATSEYCIKLSWDLFMESRSRKTAKMRATAMHASEVAGATVVPGRYKINLFPWLRHLPEWLPGMNWVQEAREIRQILQKMLNPPFDEVRRAHDAGVAKPSFALSMIQDDCKLDDTMMAKAAAAAIFAGADTTTYFVQFFIYCMIQFPEVQRKAQEEIDRVVGGDRLPSFDDYKELPYLEAVIKELLRWRPTAPISIPHILVQDDEYQGCIIPKDSIIVPNIWAMAMDTKIYDRPEEFDPDRFMVPNPPMDPRLFVLGVGRRICPGMHYAEVVYFSALSTIIATAHVVKARDYNGAEIPLPPGGPTQGKLVIGPLPFSYQLEPRSRAALRLLQ